MPSGDKLFASDFTGKRWVAGNGIVASTAAIGVTETAAITVGTFLYKAGRAYCAVTHGGATASVANNTPLFRVRKTNAAGAQLDAFRCICISTASSPVHYTSYFKVGGTDVSAALCLTIVGAAGFNAVLTAASSSPAAVNVYELEDAANFGWAPTLV
jgi:hypothetical protein